MKEEGRVRNNCLKVPKQFGQKAIFITKKMELLHSRLKVISDMENVYVPLDRKPSVEQKAVMRKSLPDLEIARHIFESIDPKKKTVIEAISEVLPHNILQSFPRSMDFVGEIAIIEIPSDLDEYKKIIGETILKVHSHVRTVLAKSSHVSGVYRLRDFEIVAGSPKTETLHKEYGCKYLLDLRKVYFSPRLSYERQRVASKISEKETIIDMFAGVGPFSILIAKMIRDISVYAVDINPDAIRYLKKNVLMNRVEDKVMPVLGDAKEVIYPRLKGAADRVIMNLPENARKYLGIACDALRLDGGIIHYYEFVQGMNSVNSVKDRLRQDVAERGRKIQKFLFTRPVREVAPLKWQVAFDIKIH